LSNLKYSLDDVKTLLLVGGLGTRLRSVVPSTPKPLASVGERPFLELLVGQLSNQGIRHLVMCTGYLAGEIERAVAGYRAALQKGTDIEALRAHLLQQEKTAQAMLEAGESSRVDLIGVRLQLSASAVARLDSLTKSQQALGQLEDALQSPLGLSPSAWQTSPRLSTKVTDRP